MGLPGVYYISLYNNLYNNKLKENVQSVFCCIVVEKLTTLLYMLYMYVNCITSVICMCIDRRRRQRKNRTFLQFSQPWPWTLNRFTENQPVALADVLDPSAEEKDQVDLHVEPTPGVYYMHSVYI